MDSGTGWIRGPDGFGDRMDSGTGWIRGPDGFGDRMDICDYYIFENEVCGNIDSYIGCHTDVK
jgi:hypothetical protein